MAVLVYQLLFQPVIDDVLRIGVAQMAHIIALKELAGPRLVRLTVHEPYIPLLHLLPRLTRLSVYEHRRAPFQQQPGQHINVLVLATLPVLQFLSVYAVPSHPTHTRHLEELKQIQSLTLRNTLPELALLPAGLSSLHLRLDAPTPARLQQQDCVPMLQRFSGSLSSLVLKGYFQQLNHDPARLSALTGLQKLTDLVLSFNSFPSQLCTFVFPLLKQLMLEVLWPAEGRPCWDLRGCPQLAKVDLTLRLHSARDIDLAQVVGLQTHFLQIHLDLREVAAESSRVLMSCTSWKVNRVRITFQTTAVKEWRSCPCVKDLLAGFLGVVPFSNVHVDGLLASQLLAAGYQPAEQA